MRDHDTITFWSIRTEAGSGGCGVRTELWGRTTVKVMKGGWRYEKHWLSVFKVSYELYLISGEGRYKIVSSAACWFVVSWCPSKQWTRGLWFPNRLSATPADLKRLRCHVTLHKLSTDRSSGFSKVAWSQIIWIFLLEVYNFGLTVLRQSLMEETLTLNWKWAHYIANIRDEWIATLFTQEYQNALM